MNWLRSSVVCLLMTACFPNQPVRSEEVVAPPVKPVLNGTLKIDAVLAEVLLRNPELQAFSFEVRAREARVLQAGLWPNPQLQVQAEDITGTGAFDSFRNTQTTVQLSQWIRLGGKIAKRERIAGLSRDSAQWDYEIKRTNILTGAAQAFTDVLIYQAQTTLAKDLVTLAERNMKTVLARVKAGKASPVEEVKARVALAKPKMVLAKVQSQLLSARRRLANFWGASLPQFKQVAGDLYALQPLPSFEALIQNLKRNPDLKRWGTELIQRKAQLEFEESKAIPDIQLQGAFRRIEEVQENTLVVGIAVPLNIFDRNQGGIAEARNRLSKIEAEQKVVQLKLESTLAETFNRLAIAHQQATTLKTEILPGATTAFKAVEEGYRFGKFGLLDVLDSQRTLFRARSSYLEALGNYHKSVLAIERLTGAALKNVSTTPAKETTP